MAVGIRRVAAIIALAVATAMVLILATDRRASAQEAPYAPPDPYANLNQVNAMPGDRLLVDGTVRDDAGVLQHFLRMYGPDGATLWTATGGSDYHYNRRYGPAMASDGSILVIDSSSSEIKRIRPDGEILWTASAVSSVMSDDNGLWVDEASGRLYFFATDDYWGANEWDIRALDLATGEPVSSTPPVSQGLGWVRSAIFDGSEFMVLSHDAAPFGRPAIVYVSPDGAVNKIVPIGPIPNPYAEYGPSKRVYVQTWDYKCGTGYKPADEIAIGRVLPDGLALWDQMQPVEGSTCDAQSTPRTVLQATPAGVISRVDEDGDVQPRDGNLPISPFEEPDGFRHPTLDAGTYVRSPNDIEVDKNGLVFFVGLTADRTGVRVLGFRPGQVPSIFADSFVLTPEEAEAGRLVGSKLTLSLLNGKAIVTYEVDDREGIAVLDMVEVTGELDVVLRHAGAETPPPPVCEHGNVTVVSARGSGEDVELAGRYGLAVHAALAEDLGDSVDTRLVGVDYPAIPVDDVAAIAKAYLLSKDLGGAYLLATAAYANSVDQGVDALVAKLAGIAASPGCGTDQPVVLVGYSQGAHVVQLGLERIDGTELAKMPASVGLISSPMFTWTDPTARGSFPHSATGIASAVVGRYSTAPVRTTFAEMTRSWCLSGDFVCDLDIVNKNAIRVHTGSDYGVTESDGAIDGIPAITDVINTALWALGRRGVPVPDPTDPSIEYGPTASRLESSIARQRDGRDYWSRVWWSAAEIINTDGPVNLYLWDFDGDGTNDAAGPSPTATFDYDLWVPKGSKETSATGTLRVIAPGGVDRTYSICFDLKKGIVCPTR